MDAASPSLPSSLQGSLAFTTISIHARKAIQRLNDALKNKKTIDEEGHIEGEVEEVQEKKRIEEIIKAEDLINPTTLPRLQMIVKEYDKRVVGTPEQIRTYVVNRLIEESNTAKPSDRIKALELIGKIEDVGLFVERSKKTVEHAASGELAELLKQRLQRIIELDKDEFEDVDVETSGKTTERMP